MNDLQHLQARSPSGGNVTHTPHSRNARRRHPGSPPPITEMAPRGRLHHGLGDYATAGIEWRSLKDTHRSVPYDRPGRHQVPPRQRRTWSRSSPINPSGIPPLITVALAVSSRFAAMMIHWKQHRCACPLGRPEHEWLRTPCLPRADCCRWPRGRQKRVGHPPTDDHRVDTGQQVANGTQLVGHLGPTQHRDEWRRGMIDRFRKETQLLLQQQPGDRG